MGEKKKRRKRGFETKQEVLEFERSKKLSSERSRIWDWGILLRFIFQTNRMNWKIEQSKIKDIWCNRYSSIFWKSVKSLGFEGGSKQDTELNQWINHEKEVLVEIALQHGIEWGQKGHMRSIWTFIILRKKSVKKKCRYWNRKKNILQQRMKALIVKL